MNLHDFGTTIEQNEAVEDDSVVTMFLESFKRKTKFHASLFENSFTQKLNTSSLLNFHDHSSTKFCEYTLTSADFLTDLHSLSAHVRCKIVEEKSDGSLVDLKNDLLVGTIPSSIVSNLIKNFWLFIYDTQISTEKSDRYSLVSYITQYFNAQSTYVKHWDPDSGE